MRLSQSTFVRLQQKLIREQQSTQVALQDGYYYQLNVDEPRRSNGWLSTTKFHDGSEGDTLTRESTPPSGIHTSLIWLVVKNSGMTIDEFEVVIWYTQFPDPTTLYGSNDLIHWDEIAYQTQGEPFHPTFSAEAFRESTLLDYGPYKYISGFTGNTDPSIILQSAVSDVRLYLNGVEVGPP